MSECGYDGARAERELIESILDGRKDEFRRLIEIHEQRVFLLIYKQVGERSTALDLTQETFVRAFTSLSGFRFESAFSTWLMRIALNVTNTYFSSRSYKEQSRSVSLESAAVETFEQKDDQDRQMLEQLRSAMITLPQKHREVLVLCGLEQKSYQEAADILRIPIGTVRSRLNKARNLLRRRYFEA